MTASRIAVTPRRYAPATGTMRAAWLVAPGVPDMAEVPVPAPRTGQVRVRLEGCGVCASSAPVWEGREWFTYPREPGAPGHEGWGVIDAVGDGVSPGRLGERVAVLSHHAFAEYDVASATEVVPLPASLAGVPFPGEAFGCAMNAFARADVREGQDVAVVGAGFLGVVCVRLAAQAGARVIAVSRRPASLELARDFGAQETVPMDDHDRIIRRVRALTQGDGCDRVFECVGLQWPLDLAAELTRERGRLIIAGYHQDGPRQVNLQLWNWRGLDVINAHERAPAAYVTGMQRAVEAVAHGVLDPRPLVTHDFPLESLGEAFRTLAARPEGFCKAWIRLGD